MCTTIGGEEFLEVRADWPAAACGPQGVRIDVAAAGVNFPDFLIIRDLYQMRMEPPFVPGSECSGTVVEVGAEVHELAAGDRVLALPGVGAFQEDVVVTPPMPVLRIPDAMPFDDAAAFNMTYGTACHAWDRGQLQPGETVLVLGAAGGCGSAAVEIAKVMGATVIAAAGGPAKLALCTELGADHVVDYTEVESLADVVSELTGGRGVDAVFDTVGGADIRDYLRCLAWNGRYLVVGFASGDVPTVRLYQTIAKSISIVGVAYGQSAMEYPDANRRMFDRLFAWYEAGELRPRIHERFPLDDGADAIRVLGERRAMGKVVIEIARTD